MQKVIRLSSKPKLIITLITDILFTSLIPPFIYILIINFNVIILSIIIMIYLFVILISTFNYNKRIIINDNFIIFVEVKRTRIAKDEITSISMKRFIVITTNRKNYRFSGYTFLTSIDESKNEELVKELNELLKK